MPALNTRAVVLSALPVCTTRMPDWGLKLIKLQNYKLIPKQPNESGELKQKPRFR